MHFWGGMNADCKDVSVRYHRQAMFTELYDTVSARGRTFEQEFATNRRHPSASFLVKLSNVL